ncbi:hypothetical protein CSAL01_04557 [Colletotrichum salicis]|uniref:Uncharacterized protein n=1 Tax=Colletotrichum salicis TaxID=1209931 RepID=A0A135USU6_9PEZI|nr:hypothetical protein CSAL01_04557 [Colletotrichum salicis]
MGVADSSKSARRFISIAAGEDYKALNATQCTIDFVATLFNVSVDLKDRSIMVIPSKSIEDFDPQRDLTRAIVRQFDSISNSLQGFHGFVLGDVVSSHIAAWKSSLEKPAAGTIATPIGLQSFFITMVDAMLVAYGSTQLEMGRNSRPAAAEVVIEVFTVGNKACLFAVAALNTTALWLHWKLKKGAQGRS